MNGRLRTTGNAGPPVMDGPPNIAIFGLVFTVLELQVWKMIVLGENAMGNPQRKALLATILLTALGAGFMIAALINVLETVPFVLFFAGLGLILGSIQLTIRKAGAARD